MRNDIYLFLIGRIKMDEEHEKKFIEVIMAEHNELKTLDNALNDMFKAKMYKQMLPILEQIKPTAKNIYDSYIERVSRAYEYEQKKERMMQ